jgi:hypothetical protein
MDAFDLPSPARNFERKRRRFAPVAGKLAPGPKGKQPAPWDGAEKDMDVEQKVTGSRLSPG